MNREYNNSKATEAQLEFSKAVHVESMMNKELALNFSRMLQKDHDKKQYQIGEKSR